MSLNIGDPAPSFSLPNSEGNPVSLADFQGQWLVIFFYPRDNTPGCTTEACGFRDHYDRLQEAGVALLGINTDNEKSHQKFISKYNLPFPLLCDSDAAVATRYESYGLKKFMGKEFMGIFRKSFIIDPSGKIAKIYPKVKPANHGEEVLADLIALQGTG
ncbi:MAG: thioredoxin-dependent thiol peroxidase, partial [Prochlorotrichaceae cyanobacterium]